MPRIVLRAGYIPENNGHRFGLQGVSCPGLNEVIYIKLLAQSLADKTYSMKVHIMITITIVAECFP